MFNKNKTEKIDQVGATIIFLMGELGVFHYNKLSYLFEYFFIKNFGQRYTKEKFIKLPHGPVISNYKAHLNNLYRKQFISVNIEKLNISRKLEDDYNLRIPIRKTDQTERIIITNEIVFSLIKAVIEKFGQLSVHELEKVVYKTLPLKNFMMNPFKKDPGGYILKSDNIKIRNTTNIDIQARKNVLKHFEKYNFIDFEKHKEIAKELKELEKLRPEFWQQLEN